jgi:hypothetical protein
MLLSYVTDLLLVTASLGAAAYCMVLSRRLSRLGSFDKGIGSAIAVLSAQVEEMKAALGEAKAGSDGAGRQLKDLVRQAQDISAELEMMIAACHDFAETAIQVQNDGPSARIPGDAPEVPPMTPCCIRADLGCRSGHRRQRPIVKTGEIRAMRSGGECRSSGRAATPLRTPEADGEKVPMFRHRAGTGV